MDSHKVDLIAAAAFLAGAAVMGRESFDEIYQASGVGVAHDAVFYPRLVLCAITLLALMLAVQALFRSRPPEAAMLLAAQTAEGASASATFGWRSVVAIVVSTALYAALIPVAGYLTSTFLFVAAVPPLLGFRRWRALTLTIVLFPMGSWLLFTRVIQIPLPTSPFSILG